MDHIFENSEAIKTQISDSVNLRYIYGTLDEQLLVVKILIEIDKIRTSMKDNILPGGSVARTHVDT